MLVARRQIDGKAPAQRVEAGGRPRKTAARHRQRVDERAGERAAAEPRQFGIEECEIEFGVVNDQAVAGDELGHRVGDRGKGRMPGEEFGVQPMHHHGVGRDIALGVDIAVQLTPGRHMMKQFEAGDLDDPVPVLRVKPGGFRVDHDLAHDFSPR